MDYRIKDLPKNDRPREKLEQNGVKSLSEVELLSLILRTGTSGKNVKELSSEIMNSYSIPAIADRSKEELENFDGVSRVKAGQLKAVSELSRRMQKEDREEIKNLSDVRERVEDMKYMQSELMRIFVLSSGNKILKEEEIGGDVDSVNFSPRKIFRPAINHKGSAIILAHNHPSGNAEPTEKDLETTREIIELGDSMGIRILDHVIVGEEVKSMKAESTVGFE